MHVPSPRVETEKSFLLLYRNVAGVCNHFATPRQPEWPDYSIQEATAER
jgi:hypothetical protein